ncbi:MAG: hypothetical protein AAGA54_36790 [Myxococcota bacterium]
MLKRLLLATVFCVACDSSEPSVSEALADADAKEAKKKADEEAAKKAATPKKDPNALEMPWTVDSMKDKLEMGLTLEYAVTGTDAKGKPVEDTYLAEVKALNPDGIGVVAYHTSAKGEAAKQLATTPWSKMSPFFRVEKAEETLLKKESVETPAGTFDCVAVELKGFFGEHRTVWMIADKPGVYAKIVEHANTSAEDDQTEKTYTLASMKTVN